MMDEVFEYTRDLDHLTSSGAKLILKSERLLYNRYGPDASDDKKTPAMLLGTAAHLLLLNGEDTFRKVCRLNPHPSKRSKVFNEWLEQEGCDPDMVFSPEDWDKLHRMRDALREPSNTAYNALADELLSGGAAERTFKWVDGETGCPCKARFDYVAPGADRLVDLKTTRSAHPSDFGKAVIGYQYYLSAEFYKLGYEDSYLSLPDFYWGAVESDGSHVEVYEPREIHQSKGLSESRDAMRLFMDAKERNFVGGYNEKQLGILEVPTWFR